MFGYMTRKEAKELGYKYGGRYYGIPVYFTEKFEDEDGPLMHIAATWAPCDYLALLIIEIEIAVKESLYPFDEAVPRFLITEEL